MREVWASSFAIGLKRLFALADSDLAHVVAVGGANAINSASQRRRYVEVAAQPEAMPSLPMGEVSG